MLTFEKILQVFEDILRKTHFMKLCPPATAIRRWGGIPTGTSGYSAELLETPEDMLDALLGVYSSNLERQFTGGERDDLTEQEEEEMEARCQRLRNACLSE